MSNQGVDMIVYRVEHNSLVHEEDGLPLGPFCDVDVFPHLHGREYDDYAEAVRLLVRHVNPLRYPTPWADPMLRGINPSEVCAVDSPEAAEEWFGPALPLLKKCGFGVHEYEVPDWAVRRGTVGQVLFQYIQGTRVQKETDV